ncbi:hypothetical protein ROZALSC1DRAFT_22187 [Rozella allomycis CSF55]|uniref:Fringe-like glycosyltransferase domain-containing protein n=1 Tax=Rozella allomycis (strain CSF55) TaxID=988480 RepID=A0A4P9YJI8_ROZAC|nr:hypothetical protein ROZALSC1DRAFT_22187 [Rozella allomycis CSF55]
MLKAKSLSRNLILSSCIFAVVIFGCYFYFENPTVIQISMIPTEVQENRAPKSVNEVNEVLYKVARSSCLSYITQLSLESMISEFVQPKEPLFENDILFVVMGSKKFEDRTRVLRETWLSLVSQVYIFADEQIEDLGMISLEELKGKSSFEDAQHRQIKGLQWLFLSKKGFLEKFKWIMLVDDDTFVNVENLILHLNKYDHRLLISFGYVWDREYQKDIAFYSGGAGIIISGPALIKMVPSFYSWKCPYKGANDLTISYCINVKTNLIFRN